MPKRVYTRHNRPVTACRECHRRKQKCDRSKPCNVCLARNVSHKCIYGDDSHETASSEIQNEFHESLTPPSDHSLNDEPESEALSQAIEEQFGYSALNDTTLGNLQRSINAIYSMPVKAAKRRLVPMRPQAKARYQKIAAELPNEFICKSIVDVYFTEANWYFMALDRYYFERLQSAWFASTVLDEDMQKLDDYPRDLQHFPALLFQVLAVSLQFLPVKSPLVTVLRLKDREGRDKKSKLLSELGYELMNTTGRYPASTTSIEHDIMRMSWLKNCSRGSESWHGIGSAISQAQDLELHLDSKLVQAQATSQEIWYDEYRRRIWTRLLSLDSYMALVSGRPRHIHLDDCTVRQPTNCDIPSDPSIALPAVPTEDEKPSTFTYTMFLSTLALKIHEALSIRNHKADEERRKAMEGLQRDADDIIRSLPSSMQPQNPNTRWDSTSPHLPKIRRQIISTYSSFMMQLHRPYVKINKTSHDIVVQAALTVLDAQQEIFDLMDAGSNQQKVYGLSFSTVDAALMLSALVLDPFPQILDLDHRIERCLRQAIDRLILLKDTSAIAMSGMQLLGQCYSEIQVRHPGAFALTVKPSDEVTIAGAAEDNIWEGYILPQPQDFDISALPDIFDSGEYLLDENDISFIMAPHTDYVV